MKIRLLIGGGVILAVAVAATLWWTRIGAIRPAVRAALPPIPDVSALPAEFRTRLERADAQARGWLSPRAGLEAAARLYHANGFLGEAAACYSGLEKLEPDNARWLHLHASILAGYGEIDAALRLWDRVLRLAPDYLAARLRVGDCLLKANRPADAAAAYTEVLRREPGNPYALLGLARLDLEAGRWDPAREKLEDVVRRTNFALGYDLIVTLYERLGQVDRAEAIRGAMKASGAYRDPPDPWLDALLDDCLEPYRLSLAAGVAARTGDDPGARRLLERAVALSPDDVSVHFQLGTLAAAQGDRAVAREQLEWCVHNAPNFADGWAHLSTLEANAGDAAASAKILEDGLKACPDSPGLHLLRARDLKKAGQVGDAMAELRTSIQLRPNEPDAYVELANLYLAQGRETEAIEQLHAALEADPGEPIALGALALHAVTAGDEAEAARWMRRTSLQPRVPREMWTRLLGAYRQAFGHDWAEHP